MASIETATAVAEAAGLLAMRLKSGRATSPLLHMAQDGGAPKTACGQYVIAERLTAEMPAIMDGRSVCAQCVAYWQAHGGSLDPDALAREAAAIIAAHASTVR